MDDKRPSQHDRQRPSQRKRGRSVLRIIGLVLMAVGLLAIVLALGALYTPDTANPVLVDFRPLLGLSNIAGFGIFALLFGLLAYFFSLQFGR